jgi:hypothetical protein
MTPDEIEKQYVTKFAEAVLHCGPLVDSDSHDDGGALMTKDRAWYFVPHPDDPVMSSPRIGRPPAPIVGRHRWAVEVIKVTPATRDEPEEWDLLEIAREDSLMKAIEAAAHAALDRDIRNIGEGLFWEKERQVEAYLGACGRDIDENSY